MPGHFLSQLSVGTALTGPGHSLPVCSVSAAAWAAARGPWRRLPHAGGCPPHSPPCTAQGPGGRVPQRRTGSGWAVKDAGKGPSAVRRAGERPGGAAAPFGWGGVQT